MRISLKVVTLRLAAALTVFLTSPVFATEALVRPAADGVFAAFKQHPLVGIGDNHGLAEEGEFYERLIRDQRFAAEVGNVVFEAASGAHQTTLDRYLNGKDVPRAELRKVWSDVSASPTVTSVMYQQFLAAVRAVNLSLAPVRRIRVWAGEPPIDWTTIRTPADLAPYLMRRDEHAAAIIEREILGRRKKALVIYGGLHFSPLPSPPGFPPNPGLKGLVERVHPGAFYIIQPYSGFWQPDCTTAFESETRWPAASLISPVKGTPVEGLLLRQGCTTGPPPTPAPGAPPIPPEVLAKIQAPFLRVLSGADADGLLYLAPAATLTRSADDPDLVKDPAYSAEITRRLPVTGAPVDWMSRLAMERRPFRDATTQPSARRGALSPGPTP